MLIFECNYQELFLFFKLSFSYADYNYELLCIVCHVSTGFPQTKEMLDVRLRVLSKTI